MVQPQAADAAAQGMIVAQGQAPQLAFHLSNGQWSHAPLLWGYLAAALTLIALCWWLARRWRPWLRTLVRAGSIAVLLSPAILACESISVLPFPALVWHAAMGNPAAFTCGAPYVALPPNAMTVAGVWLVLWAALWGVGWLRQPGTASAPPAQ